MMLRRVGEGKGIYLHLRIIQYHKESSFGLCLVSLHLQLNALSRLRAYELWEDG